ncbi:MAG: hypothetical protein VX498_05445 [Myxococcota bacterium]|nr:hypothetical protein [Myxococcota bacterium]
MRSWLPLLALASLLVTHSALAQDSEGRTADPVLVDRVIATVGNTPITASQAALEAQIRERIEHSGDKEDFGRLLTEAVDPLEALIFREILRMLPEARVIEVDEVQARGRLRAFEETFPDAATAASFRAGWGLDRARLLDYFKESVVLDKLVERSVDVRVSDEEQRAYYQRNKDRVFGGRPFEEVADFVAKQVYMLKFEAEYNSWRSRLRAAARKRYIGR